MKVGVGQAPVFAKISSAKLDLESRQEKQEKTEQNRLQNTAFVELKKTNQEIAKLQALGVSFAQIQKELGEIEDLDSRLHRGEVKKDLLQKIKNLQSKLTPLLREAKQFKGLKIPQKLVFEKIDQTQKELSEIRHQIHDQIKKAEKEIEGFFASNQEFDLDSKMLKDERFKVAHQPSHITPSLYDLFI